MDVDPQADRLIFFFSDKRNPHEVMPVFRPRYAITIWYFDHHEKMSALEKRKHVSEGEEGDSDTLSGISNRSTREVLSESADENSEGKKGSKAVPRKVKRLAVGESDSEDEGAAEGDSATAKILERAERAKTPRDYYEI